MAGLSDESRPILQVGTVWAMVDTNERDLAGTVYSSIGFLGQEKKGEAWWATLLRREELNPTRCRDTCEGEARTCRNDPN
jgi:hypothetical protein